MTSDRRILRIAESLREVLVDLLRKEVKDPRVRMVTITAVQVSPDLRHARVYFHCIGDHEAQQRCLTGLQSASGFLRTKLGKALHVRRVPSLQFHVDSSFEPFPSLPPGGVTN